MKLVVDRFEDDCVVCEDENQNMVNILKDEIEGDVKEGDILAFYDGKYIVDKEETVDRKEYIEDLIKDLWED